MTLDKAKYIYEAKILEVYDADTVTAEIDLGFNIKMKEKLRLFGINAPEMRGAEKENGIISRDFLRSKVLEKKVTIMTEKDKKGKYGRYLAHIYVDGEYINAVLVKFGYAKYKTY